MALLAGLVVAGFVVRAEDIPVIQVTQKLPALVGFRSVARWKATDGVEGARIWSSPILETATPWNEVIVSWNVEPARHAGLIVEASVPADADDAVWSRWYRLGDWSLHGSIPVIRASVSGQKDQTATVKTDTLVLSRSTRRLRLRLTGHGELAGQPDRLRFVGVSLADGARTARVPARPPLRSAWGRSLEVPERSQIAFPGGEGWCSPTSVSMVLGWWARALGRPELDRDVPEVVAGVHDPGWPGTGNWPFNTAYAGSFAGMLACAARLPDLRSVEELVESGVPLVLSVYPPALRGRDKVMPNSGHLVVCTGFTPEGDVRANDPWARIEEGQRVARVYPRANVERAWEHAHRLAYVILPWAEARRLPAQWVD